MISLLLTWFKIGKHVVENDAEWRSLPNKEDLVHSMSEETPLEQVLDFHALYGGSV